MFPPTSTPRPDSLNIRPSNVVVVDFPFVPVIATIGPFTHREASSSSPMISAPCCRAASNTGCSVGTPGLTTTRSAFSNVAVVWPPNSSSTPASRSRAPSSTLARLSVSTTRAPRRTSSSAAAMPLRAAPTTTARRPTTENASPPTSSPQLQRCQTEQRKNDRRDQKSRDDLRLAPSEQLEVVVQRCHLEHALAGQLEGGDLDDHRHPLEHEDAADDRQQQFLLDENGHGAERAAQG